MQGLIIRGVGGFYYVSDGENVYACAGRGNLKRNKEKLYVGDVVEFKPVKDAEEIECVITAVLERKNFFIRPPVSNVDMLLVMFAAASPEINAFVIDKLCAASEQIEIPVTVCITKKDLVSPERLRELESMYEGAYDVYSIDNISGEGVKELLKAVSGNKVALAGPSGVGKSTFLNAVVGAYSQETGEISKKTGRGKHTTRHVEIFDIGNDTYIYDTPGFTSINVPAVHPSEIRNFFPEFREYAHMCRYSDCYHLKEPDCAIKEALLAGEISQSRYESYKMMVEEASKSKF